MRKLLSANFARLWRSRLFSVVMLTAVILSGLSLFANQFEGASTIKYMDYPFVSQFVYNPVILAAFLTLHLGTEYSDGTIRNKLAVGHSRLAVYRANLCVSIVICLLFTLVQIAVSLAVGPLLFAPFRMPLEHIAAAAVTACLTAVSSAAVYTALAMNIQNKAASVIASISAAFAVLLMVNMIAGVLYAPEMVHEYSEKTATGLIYGPLVPNPGYIRGTARRIAEWINDILPNGQLYSVYSYDFERCARWPWLSAFVFFTASLVGYGFFRKKDIK